MHDAMDTEDMTAELKGNDDIKLRMLRTREHDLS